MKKGKLIVLEGNDGSGKGTQLKLLREYLDKNNIPYAIFDFPQYGKTFFGKFVGDFLTGKFGHAAKINPYLSMFPYAGDRWQAKENLKKALFRYKIVVCNRYTPSIAYQLAKTKKEEKEKFLNWSETLEYDIFNIPHEDLVLFLYMPYNLAHKLISQKGEREYLKNKAYDQYEENVSYLKKVEKTYLWLYAKKKNWVKIDCVQNNVILPPTKIHQKIIYSLKIKKAI